jgi:ABC-type multidrug transport system fused ATPase/permease subunit
MVRKTHPLRSALSLLRPHWRRLVVALLAFAAKMGSHEELVARGGRYSRMQRLQSTA